MGVLTWADAEILSGPYRLTRRSNKVDLELGATELDVTNFDSGGWMESIGGLSVASSSVDGFYDASALEAGALALDEQLFSELAAARFPLTIAPTKADGSVAYVAGVKRGSLKLFGQIGDVASFSSDMWGDGRVGRGNLIHPADTTETAGGNGTGVQLGATVAGQSLLAAVHVVAVSGTSPELTVTVESDDNGSFTTPATVATTGAVSAPTSLLAVVGGPITDDWYRVTWTLTGTTPVARFAAAVALSPAP